jgi:hypothetical protein
MLWVMAVVAAFLGGMVIERKLDTPVIVSRTRAFIFPNGGGLGRQGWEETIRLRDGTEWQRSIEEDEPQK